MAFLFKPTLKPLLLALAGVPLATSLALAQTNTTPQTLESITVTAVATQEPVLDADNADVGGFNTPLAKMPQSVTVIGTDLLSATATQSLSQALKLDASLSDSYNTTGFMDSMAVRGFLLDQNSSYRRNGLAISNYLPLALENKERIEVLKGVAGMQNGVSSPGGLVNYVTKVPQQEDFTTASFGGDQYGTAKVHLDANRMLGNVGVRLNVAGEKLDNQFNNDGNRQFVSLALATALTPQTSISADLEYHRKTQPSVPGFGLLDSNSDGLGDTLPAVNQRFNFNSQSWSQPMEYNTTTAELALKHSFNADWQARASVNTQRSHINDRVAFPDGCPTTGAWFGLCANGDVGLYDWRSEGEQRNMSAWDAHVDGKFTAIGIQHNARLGLAGNVFSVDVPAIGAFNYVGTTNIYTPIALPANPTPSWPNTNSRERSVQSYASISSALTSNLQSFVGLRTSSLRRSSKLGYDAEVVIDQTITTPWAGLALSPTEQLMTYISWGQGVELEAVINPPFQDMFTNPGQPLPALKSEQTEVGLKWQANTRLLFTAAAFSINKPYADNVATNIPSSIPNQFLVTRVAGAKTARHRGLELALSGRVDEALSLQLSAMALDARYTAAVNPALVGQRVTNVPRLKTSLFADYKIRALPGLALNALASYESGKTVTADGSVELPSTWQLDVGASYSQRLAGQTALWRVNVENLTDRIYWREAPTASWGGTYLFPSTPRTLRASVTVYY